MSVWPWYMIGDPSSPSQQSNSTHRQPVNRTYNKHNMLFRLMKNICFLSLLILLFISCGNSELSTFWCIFIINHFFKNCIFSIITGTSISNATTIIELFCSFTHQTRHRSALKFSQLFLLPPQTSPKTFTPIC